MGSCGHDSACILPTPESVHSIAMELTHEDREQLNIIRIGHWVVAVITALMPCLLGAWLTVIASIPQKAADGSTSNPPIGPFLMLVAFFGCVYFLFAALNVYAAICVTKRENHSFVFVTSIINCFFAPLGTALGIITLLVITRPQVKEVFLRNSAAKMTFSPTTSAEAPKTEEKKADLPSAD